MQVRKLKIPFLIISNLVVALLFLGTCMTPFLASGDFWFVAMTGFGFPLTAVALLLFGIYWLVKKSKWGFVSLLCLLLGWQQFSVAFAYRPKKEFQQSKADQSIRVLSWNVSRWDERNKEKKGGASYRAMMMDFIQLQNADVLCFQEFFESSDPLYFEANIPAIVKMGYPHYYFFPSSNLFENKFKYGLCIFSRFPITDSAGFLTEKGAHSEGLSYVDINAYGQSIRVFNTHLESPGLNKEDFSKNQTVKFSRTVISKLKNSYRLRNHQANFAAEKITTSPHPVIVCANVDDIPHSYAYFRLRGDLQDAFLKKGSGFGRTFRFISPSLRIDGIFAAKQLETTQFSTIQVPYSDHYPILADFKIFK
jgi:endonuclease/exonuclease/phosphatase family metal-dependent hydrolase